MSSLDHCALLFAIPLTREDFDLVFSRERLRDYGAQLSGGGEQAEGLWTDRFRAIAAEGSELAEFAETRDARVFRRATLADVADATGSTRVLILFAHLWSAFYAPRHLLDPVGIDAKLTASTSPVARFVDRPGRCDAEVVAETLNRLIGNPAVLALLPEPAQRAAARSPSVAHALCRDLLDEFLAGLVDPGNRIELYDGAYAPRRFAAAIDGGFNGEIDLATCNSTIVSTAIEMRFDLQVRLASRMTLTVPHPEFRMTLEALKIHADAGGSYLDARALVATRLWQIATERL